MMWLMIGIAMIATRVGAASDLHEYRLNNGLRLVIKEDHRAPVVLSQIWYGVGSANEHSGITGLSHVLEHMMFKGTPDYPAGSFSAIIAENGGRENAFTSRDYTGYYQLLEKSRLEISFELESDRMRNLSFPEEGFRKELEVVKEERRLRTDDSPEALSFEQLFATAFNNAPYRNPVIGWMEDLDGMRIEDLRRWYNRWYVPNNAILVVVGDVEPERIYRLAQKYYGAIEASPRPVAKPRREPVQRGMRRVVVKAPAELPYLLIGYKVPVLGRAQSEWEPYALEVLTAILDGGRSSRFSKKLMREQELAASAGAGYSLYGRYNGLLIIEGVPAQGHTIKELEQALNEELGHLREQQVNESELKRVKAQVVAEEVYSRDSISRQASLIGRVQSIGLGWKVLDEYVDAIHSVTADQIQVVARKFLVDDQKTVVILEPLPIHSPNDTVLADQASES
ncbi:MAG: insulinase family protein [Gammaproteobacteria bacterium]|nr:insulinase family protein [Gammaproteobacteria bacterium]